MDRPRPKRLPTIAGLPPSLANRPTGCHLRPRCPHEFAECVKIPPLESRGESIPTHPSTAEHTDRCWLSTEQKVALREFAPGEIGLGTKGAAA
jgi:ABC-type dipeptide/oligopeptide/nickel transport system ATPase component